VRHVCDGEFERAGESLAAFVLAQARCDLGFGWRESPDAPSTFEQVLHAYFQSCEQQTSYPVAIVGCMTSIYPTAEVNGAFRFWHDMTHVRLLCSFEYWDERAVAEHHLTRLEAHGFARGSLEWLLLRADAIGQNEYQRLSGRFVADQRAFALSAVEHGLGIALLHELHSSVPPPPAVAVWKPAELRDAA
jgi:hypothetical protein